MGRWGYAAVLATTIATGSVLAQGADGGEGKRRLVEQKLRLIETLLKSPAAQGAETEAATGDGRATLALAREALAADRVETAAALADEALKRLSTAKRGGGAAALSESAQRKSMEDLGAQLVSYRSSVVELAGDPTRAAAAGALLARIDGDRAQADRLAASGQLGEANRVLADAYRFAVEEIARLREGQEVVMTLKFASPADEFAYEQRRYAANDILVQQMLAQGKADGGRQGLVERFAAEARRQRDEAEALAASGDHAAAIGVMEKAVGQLNRALQTMGVPVF
jgi:hypothetical protein